MALVHGPITGGQTRTLTRRLGSVVAVLAAMGLLTAAMLLPVVQSSDAATTGYTIRQHQQELADLKAQTDSAEAAVAQLGAMNRIATEAARLGMVPAPAHPLAVSVNQPPSPQVYLPRRYLPQPATITPAVAHHGALWSLVHFVTRR